MITASVRSPTKYEAAAATASRPSSGDLSWCHSTCHGLSRCEATAFAPKRPSLLAASPADSPVAVEPSRSSTCSGCIALAAARFSLAVTSAPRQARSPARSVWASCMSLLHNARAADGMGYWSPRVDQRAWLVATIWRQRPAQLFRLKIRRKNRNTFKMSRKIDAASSGAALMSFDVRSRWKSNIVKPAKITRPMTE